MSTGGEQSKRKRRSNACVRCRRQKIKCSGRVPCDACKRRRVDCDYENDEGKVQVSKRYLLQLRNKVAKLSTNQLDSPSASPGENSASEIHPSRPVSLQDPTGPTPISEEHDEEDNNITNPVLSPRHLTYITGPEGRSYFLGHSSNYSYTQRVLRLLHSRFSQDPYPTWHPHGSSNLGWDGVRPHVTPEIDNLPSLDHAMFLLNAVKFHAGQVYHLFDDGSFTQQLYLFYSNPAEGINEMKLWYIHFLILIALGKSFIVCDAQVPSPPGADLFIHAVQLLPETTYLIQDFITSSEILCCMALYYLSVDSRVSAYDKAVRLAFAGGMHTPMKRFSIDDNLIQRYRKSWWTIVVLDRQISAYLGLPIQVQDDDITAPLPVFAESEQRTAAMAIQIGLSRVMSVVMNSVYRRDGSRNLSFISSTQKALRSVAGVSQDLATHFSLPSTGPGGGVSRISGHLNIFYHQCIVVATRPFLFAFLEKRLASSEEEASAQFWKDPIGHILMIGIESSKRISTILRLLKDQHLIETFLPFEIESAFSAGTYLAIAEANFPSIFKDDSSPLQTIIETLDVLVARGNAAARGRLSELEHLRQILGETGQLLSCEADSRWPSAHTLPMMTGTTRSRRPSEGTTTVGCNWEAFQTPQGGDRSITATIGSLAVEMDLVDWVEGASTEKLHSQPHHLNAIAECLDSWESTSWLDSLSYDV
ncbi:hypothetical protein FSARC_3427 [Fusarium sarcochroum]|uniref:Zn(2)-C6 fungal-type domain-containing protein n=1 Tax=Fusarium sarcochroum TaxID=1208366 RepID=A0A8H4U452_9HYPO|nr:hypothetical protein FSARC_3427 [Fusarium sarcochroum]